MSYDITIKRGDTRNAIKAVLKDSLGNPVNLEGCTVKFHMAPLNGRATISRAVDIYEAVAGEVWVVWGPRETDVAGVYRAEFEVIYDDGRHETFPNDGYLSVRILSDLG